MKNPDVIQAAMDAVAQTAAAVGDHILRNLMGPHHA